MRILWKRPGFAATAVLTLALGIGATAAIFSVVYGNVGEILWILLADVGVVLLIACGNVANLFLVRAEGRHQEFAMRAALGASRGRITRALLSESLTYSHIGIYN